MVKLPENVVKNVITGLGAKPARGRVRTRVLVVAKPHPAELLCDQHCHCRILLLLPSCQQPAAPATFNTSTNTQQSPRGRSASYLKAYHLYYLWTQFA